MKPWNLIEGEALPALHGMADKSVDACITDPPYSSGTTGVAAVLAGRRFIGIEREAAYAEISRNRLEAAEAEFYGVADLV